MLKKWAAFLSSLPPLYRKRLYQGIAIYILILTSTGIWVWMSSAETVREWNSRIPSAEASITTAYLTPQLTEAGRIGDFDTLSAVPSGAPEGHITLIMTDLGLSAATTDRAIGDLPAEVALAFSPYSQGLEEFLGQAHGRNRETLILLPMEPYSYPKDDPGPKALLLRYSEKENAEALQWALEKDKSSIGMMNFMGAKFLGSKKSILPVFETLHAENKAFIEATAGGLAQAQDAAATTGIPYAAVDILVDNNADEGDIRQQLLALEKIARNRGHAVGVIQPYPVTFNAVKLWASTLERRGIRLVPLSVLLEKKMKEKNNAESSPG